MNEKPGMEWRVSGWPLVILVCLPWWVGMYVIVKATIESVF